MMANVRPHRPLVVGTMSATIEFRSHVPAAQRTALEALLFFNSCQDRVSDSIAEAIERFGRLRSSPSAIGCAYI